MASDETERSRSDVAWIAMVVVAVVFGALNLFGALIGLVSGNWWPAISGALWVVVSFWFGRGAWFRTRWARGDREPTRNR